MDPFDHIEDYINNNLSLKQRAVFEEALLHNQLLQKTVDNAGWLKDIGEAIIEDEVESIMRNVQEPKKAHENKDAFPKNSEKKWSWWLGLCVLMILLTLAIFLYSKKSHKNKPVYAELYHQPAWPLERSQVSDHFYSIFTKYFNDDKAIAKRELQVIDRPESSYWLSEIFLYEAQPDSSLHYLPSTESAAPLRRDRINYIHVMSLLLKEDYKELRVFLDTLPVDTDPYYNEIYDALK